MAQFKITAGLFIRAFTFENVTKTANSSSGQNEGYSEFFKTRGYFRQTSGSRNFDTGVDLLVEVYEMYCYWRSDLEANLTKDTRIVYDNKTFRIERAQRYNENRQYYQFTLSQAK